MTTKYNIGDKVLVEATVVGIAISGKGAEYKLDVDLAAFPLYGYENEIYGKVEENKE